MKFLQAEGEMAAEVKRIPLRSEVAVEDTWDLGRLYVDDAAWEAEFARYQQEYPRYEDFKGTLAGGADKLRACLEFDREMDLLCERLGHYASLRSSEDGSDDAHLAREGRLMQAMTHAAAVASYLTPEILAIPDAQWGEYLRDPQLAEWRNRLEKIRRFKPHVLTESEERLLALGALPLSGHGETFSQLTNVDMRFGEITDAAGRTIELSHGAYSSCLVKRDADLRRRAFHQFYREFEDHKFTVASTLAFSVKSDVFQARARHYESCLEKALFADNVPVAVYENLIAAVRANIGKVSEYYALRREALGLKKLRAYDTYVPLVEGIDRETGFDEACGLVCAALAPLGDEYVSTLREGFRTRWVDRYETKGKRSGAFSSSSYGNPPYILMNYKPDVFSDIYTLAHEAGHSMHSWHSQRAQPFQDYHYPIFLAEVASTFNEELLTHHLLETTDDPRMRAYIINRQVDDIRSTLVRQTMFAEFEKRIHDAEEAGEALTLETFKAIYRELLEAYHGPELVLDEVLSLECLRIPHFYSAFYVYKYATGISAAIDLSGRVLRGEAGALERYRGFLAAGGSKYPLEALRDAGVDLESPAPVQAALDLFARRVAELRELLKQ